MFCLSFQSSFYDSKPHARLEYGNRSNYVIEYAALLLG